MSEKPALYVVEKKEVVILVLLFVLVTVLSFTMGVRYGESVGKKAALLQAAAGGAHGENEPAGGTLGAAHGGGHGEAEGEGHGHGDAKDAHGKEATEHGAGGEHGKEAAGHGEKEAPKAAAKAAESAPAPGREAADKNADEYLLNALKEAGVESPGAKNSRGGELPSDVKKVKSGSYVIQVGSHPTRSEAESQIRSLTAKKVEASVLAPFKDRQGEWHRVVIGSFKNKRDAEREANQLKAKGAILSFFVWRLP